MDFLAFSQLTGSQQEAVRAIYEEAFPAWQRVPFEAFVESDHDPSRLQLALLDGDVPLAFAAGSRFASIPWWFLEYFAVTHERRGEGLGGRLWHALTERLGDTSELNIVMEVEPPEEVPVGSTERVERDRRIEFYRRRGAVRLDVPIYRVPHLSDQGTSELTLLGIPADGRSMPAEREVTQLLQALYVEGYQLPDDDPLLIEAMTSLSHTRRPDPTARC